MQNDTIDSIAYRYFGEQSAQYLPEILNLNPNLHEVILATHQEVLLPDVVQQADNDTLKLWD